MQALGRLGTTAAVLGLLMAGALLLGAEAAWAMTKQQCEQRRMGEMKRIESDYQHRMAEATRAANMLSQQAQAEKNPKRKKELERQALAARQRVNSLHQEKNHKQDVVRQQFFNCVKMASY